MSIVYPHSGTLVPVPRDAFEGYDDPVNIDMEPEEGLKLLLSDDTEIEKEAAE